MIPARTLLYLTTLLSTVFLLAYYGFSCSRSAQTIWTSLVEDETAFALKKGDGFPDLLAKTGEMAPGVPEPALIVYARLAGLDRTIKPGRYKIGPGWSPVQILEQTALGTNDPLQVTLAPGWTLDKCAQALAHSGWIRSATAFLGRASGEEAVGRLGRSSLEGLLAPETYFFEAEEPPEKLIPELQQEWKSFVEETVGTSDLDRRLPNGLSLYSTVVLASIVEKEAADPIEMATVASVFQNRLRKNWPLGSVATLRYALRDWNRGERELPVNLASPYNTNRRPGLPPTPICIPGKEALQAALHPADTDFMFFVADGEGGTVFSKTHQEHIQSVGRYRRKLKEREPSASEP